jgi:phage gp45-like
MAIKESKTLEAQELNALKELRSKISTLTFQRGQVGLAEDNLELQKVTLQEEMQKLVQEETKISAELFEKYGKGSVDLDKGTITPIE